MLSAVVVDVNGIPGEGFFTLARALGKLARTDKRTERAFWEHEKDAVYELWKRKFS
jgi:hypothetical protein